MMFKRAKGESSTTADAAFSTLSPPETEYNTSEKVHGIRGSLPSIQSLECLKGKEHKSELRKGGFLWIEFRLDWKKTVTNIINM